MTVNLPKILGLEAGELIAGRDADFVIFDMSWLDVYKQKISTVNVKIAHSMEDRSKDEFEDYQEW